MWKHLNKKLPGSLAISIILILAVIVGGFIYSKTQSWNINFSDIKVINNKTNNYQKDIHYCMKDDDCKLWWGPNFCGCGNKYYKFEESRPSVDCRTTGDINRQCKCVNNRCQ